MVTSCEVAKVDLSTKQFEFNHQQVCLNPPELLFKSKKKHIFNPLTKSVVTNNLITRTKITCDSVAKLHVHRIKHCDFSGFYISISVCLSNHSNPYIFTIASFFWDPEAWRHSKPGDTRQRRPHKQWVWSPCHRFPNGWSGGPLWEMWQENLKCLRFLLLRDLWNQI